jgi:glutamate receptor, ionotropic, invertebrate
MFILMQTVLNLTFSLNQLSNKMTEEESSTNRYEGYVVDLINKISSNLLFKYELEVVPDGKYGNYDKKTKTWNGLVQHLLERKADMAVADISITYERKTAGECD